MKEFYTMDEVARLKGLIPSRQLAILKKIKAKRFKSKSEQHGLRFGYDRATFEQIAQEAGFTRRNVDGVQCWVSYYTPDW